MANIFLAPRSNETSYKNFLSTIENGVDYTIVEAHLNEEGREKLKTHEKLYVWGNKESKKHSWDQMEENDFILFYKKGNFVYAGKLLFKQFSKELGLALWPPKSGEEPWSCVFFLKELQPIFLPISDFNEAGGGVYSQDRVQGFMPVKVEAVRSIQDKYGSIDKFLAKYPVKKEEVGESELEETSQISETNAHREAQMLILRIGRLLGYDTYSPDKTPEAYGESLESYITLSELPKRFIGDEILPFVRKIDVIWFKDEIPKYAFEVENSTGLRGGFQRLFQLQPLNTRLYIIAKDGDKTIYDQIINVAPYFEHKDKFCFRSYKQLEKFFVETDRSETFKKSFLESKN